MDSKRKRRQVWQTSWGDGGKSKAKNRMERACAETDEGKSEDLAGGN
jgi:hypothetical protein